MGTDEIAGETLDPHGEQVVLPVRVWKTKILRSHPEIGSHLNAVLQAVANPDHFEMDPLRADRTRYFARDAGPSSWLLVVVSYEQRPARIISTFGMRKDPASWIE